MLQAIRREKHRQLTLSGRATRAFKRWYLRPIAPLESEAYVLLSNWFMTAGGDRTSMVATRCEELWDAMFAVRPPERLSSPEPGKNHIVERLEFERWWILMQKAQGDPGSEALVPIPPSDTLRAPERRFRFIPTEDPSISSEEAPEMVQDEKQAVPIQPLSLTI